MRHFRFWSVPALALVTLAASCARDFDTTRKPADTGSFGQRVYTLGCKRVAYLEDLNDGDGRVDVRGDNFRDLCRSGGDAPSDTPERLRTLTTYRDRLITAIDAAIPPALKTDLQKMLVAMTSLYDDDTVQLTIEKAAQVLDMMEKDQPFLTAMQHLDYRLGYRPLSASTTAPVSPAVGVMTAIAAYPELDTLLRTQVAAIAPAEGGSGGSAAVEFKQLMKALSAQLGATDVTTNPGAADRTLKLALDLLFTESPELSTSKPRALVVRDFRGLAAVDPTALNNPARSKFVDKNSDGLADIDAEGRFVDAAGMPFQPPTPFATPLVDATGTPRDAQGRALQMAAGPTLYRYRDLDRTVLAGLAREALDLFDPMRKTGTKFIRGASALLGTRVPDASRIIGTKPVTYKGYDTANAPLLDMIHGYLLILQDPAIDDTLQIARALLATETDANVAGREAVASRLIGSLLKVADLGKAHPESVIPATSPLYDDLVPIVVRILRTPGLTEALLRALEKPEVKGLGPLFVKYMKFKDRFDVNGPNQALTGTFATPVGRGAGMTDSGLNRSILQRLLHTIADANGARLCSKAGARIRQFGITVQTFNNECELFQIDDLAVFYVQSIAYLKDANGNTSTDYKGRIRPKAFLELKNLNAVVRAVISDSLIEDSSTIDGFNTHPTPASLNRVLFLNPPPDFIADTADPARTRTGERFIDMHVGALPVWEAENFYGKLRPVAQAFADHNAEKILVDLFSVMHKHWPTRDSLDHQFTNATAPRYAYGSGAMRYETQMIDVLEKTELLDAFVDGAPTINALRTTAGRRAPEVLAAAARWILEPKAGIKTRAGLTTLPTADGRAMVTPISPYLVLADAYARKRMLWDGGNVEAVAWQEASSSMADQMFAGEKLGTMWRFRDRRLRGILVPVVDFLRGRLSAHRTTGDTLVWLGQTLPADAERMLTGPMFASLADFLLALQGDAAARDQLDGLLAYLTDDIGASDSFQTSVTAAADIAQLFIDDADLAPVAQMMGRVVDPELGFVDQNLVLMRRSMLREEEAGVKGTFTKLIQNLFREHVPGRTPLSEILEAVHEVNRQNPGVNVGAPFLAVDFENGFAQIRGFLADNKRGLKKFIDIVKLRHDN